MKTPIGEQVLRELMEDDFAQESGSDTTLEPVLSDRLRDRISAALVPEDRSEEAKTIRLLPWNRLYRVAAVLVLCLTALGIVYMTQKTKTETAVVYEEVRVAARKKVKLTLPDGSVVWVNSKTTLKYPKQFADDIRQVFLDGEAYFEVAKNPARPFVVASGRMTTTVLGTHFNVKAYHNEENLTVSVTEGKVAVQGGSRSRVVVTPNQRALYSVQSGRLAKEEAADAHDMTAWRTNRLVFNRTPLREVARTLERTYNVKVTFKNADLANCKLNGTFDNKPLTKILMVLGSTMNLRYRMAGNTVELTGQGCN